MKNQPAGSSRSNHRLRAQSFGNAAADAFVRKVAVKWEHVPDRAKYPRSLPVFRDFDEILLNPNVTMFVGENGSGKSTLIEGVAEATGLNTEGGSSNHSFATTEHRSPVADSLRIIRGSRRPKTDFFLRGESFFNVASSYEEMGKIDPRAKFTDLHFSSHGEGFLRIIRERFGPNGLYFFDEPESALSPKSLLLLMQRMKELIGQGSQFIVATHSPILMAYPGATVYGLNELGIRPIDYRETSHYTITKQFLSDPEAAIRELLG